MPLSMPPLRPLLLKFITLSPPPPARAALASPLGLLCRHRLVQLTKPASTLGLLCPLVAPTFWRPQSTPLLPRTRPSALRHQVVKSWQLSIAAPPSTFFSVDLQALKRHTLPSPSVPEIPLAPLTVAISYALFAPKMANYSLSRIHQAH